MVLPLLFVVVGAGLTPMTVDTLPKGAIARIGSQRFLPEGSGRWFDFSAGGRRFVTGGMYGEAIKIWAYPSGHLIRTIKPGEREEVWRVTLSPDGSRVAAILNRLGPPQNPLFLMHTRVWDVATGKEVALTVHEQRVSNNEPIIFSPDGQRAMPTK